LKKVDSKIEKYHLHKDHPEKLQFEVYDLLEYRKKSGKMAATPHSHSYYQIIWFFEEGGVHSVDFTTYSIKKNTILFIPKDHIHTFDNNLDVQGWLIHFNESFFMHSDVDIFLKYNIFNVQDNPCYAIDKETASIAATYVDLMRKELGQTDAFGYEDIIRFSLKSLLIYLERIRRRGDDVDLRFTNHYELQFAKFKQLVEENYYKGLSVREYATLLNVSSKTLTTITKNVTNLAASQVISQRIILQAKRLLRFTTIQINEVAFKIGFEDVSYFVKFFKRHVGISPGKYRSEISK